MVGWLGLLVREPRRQQTPKLFESLIVWSQAEVRQYDYAVSRYKRGKWHVHWASSKCMWRNEMRILLDVLENMKS